ncbi:MAG: hypothetical protein AAB895_03110 [Patescibacteria group bacterium]
MKHDINSGWKRWILGKVINEANEGKIISNITEIEKLYGELNDFCDSIIDDYIGKPFFELEDVLYEKATKLIKNMVIRKNILTYSQILPN